MSLRPEISGFNGQQMFDLFGCQKESLVLDLIREFDQLVTFDQPSMVTQAHDILRRAVFESPPWSDCDDEGESHVFAAIVLAKHGQTHIATDSNDWHMPAFWHFIQDYLDKLPVESQKFLNMFGVGRPLFGKRIETSWSYYGFLTLKQIESLYSGLLELQRVHPDASDPKVTNGFFDEFVVWLTLIKNEKKDLWFYCH